MNQAANFVKRSLDFDFLSQILNIRQAFRYLKKINILFNLLLRPHFVSDVFFRTRMKFDEENWKLQPELPIFARIRIKNSSYSFKAQLLPV